jgi:aspartyl-tRNA(Asn)/glutamyl-tRNA(Gln) amidotransferase subunit C
VNALCGTPLLRVVYLWFQLFFTMSLTSSDITRIANLARLELAPEESEHMLAKLNDFFGIVEAMQAVDTTGIEPLAHPVATIQEISLRLRDDLVSEPNQREANQRSAPAVERGLFLVPKVIE